VEPGVRWKHLAWCLCLLAIELTRVAGFDRGGRRRKIASGGLLSVFALKSLLEKATFF